jgi:hypothetical protein
MASAYSQDLRDRVIDAVVRGGIAINPLDVIFKPLTMRGFWLGHPEIAGKIGPAIGHRTPAHGCKADEGAMGRERRCQHGRRRTTDAIERQAELRLTDSRFDPVRDIRRVDDNDVSADRLELGHEFRAPDVQAAAMIASGRVHIPVAATYHLLDQTGCRACATGRKNPSGRCRIIYLTSESSIRYGHHDQDQRRRSNGRCRLSSPSVRDKDRPLDGFGRGRVR